MNTYTITLTAGEALFLWMLRQGRGYSIVKLSKAIGQSRQQTSDILRGDAMPTDVCKCHIEKLTADDVLTQIKFIEWGVFRYATVTPGEYLITLIRRKHKKISVFCEQSGVWDCRVSEIVRGRKKPTKNEQAAIGKIFKELKEAWK